MLYPFSLFPLLSEAVSTLGRALGFSLLLLLLGVPVAWAGQTLEPQTATEGQPFRLSLSDTALAELPGPLTYEVSGLPPGLSLQKQTIIGQPQSSEGWSCLNRLNPIQQGSAGYYTVAIAARNPQAETARIQFPLKVLTAPFIVDIDTERHYSDKLGCRRSLPSGTYRLHVISRAEGGKFDAWSRKTLWEDRYYVRPGLGRVERVGRYPSIAEALKHRPEDAQLQLPIPADISFYLVDKVNVENNQGGVSVLVTQVQ
ncbi:MAG: hypothetical protein F6J93_02605 [Oscillatoria sp. SIO1A7]|nr:hypothetical protein [Oscillatoria sp. SIO1A7]